ncbi:MAG: hypothetical protein LBT56_02500 [Prevotellaceae bacterium]|nr:hypothetical protein [Prevotellaceae bacterium]
MNKNTTINFKSSYGDDAVIINDIIILTNKFGDTYAGRLVNDKVVTKAKLGLNYLTRAYNEYKMQAR